jgi:2,4-dienoyl-CoA reductase-like NADH-dependent reductase (Old Yellow Enzyme family)
MTAAFHICRRFAERIHAHGCAIMCQITHLGRRGDPYGDHWLEMIGPSPVRETRHRAIPREMDEHDIARVIKAFGDTAARCKEGGLDGIETLFGGHLVGQFLSPVTNKRTDKYGGSLENRARFALEVYREIRKRTGSNFLVGMRYIVDEGIADGLTFDEAVAVARCSKTKAWSTSSTPSMAAWIPTILWPCTTCPAWRLPLRPGSRRPVRSSARCHVRCFMRHVSPTSPPRVTPSATA